MYNNFGTGNSISPEDSTEELTEEEAWPEVYSMMKDRAPTRTATVETLQATRTLLIITQGSL